MQLPEVPTRYLAAILALSIIACAYALTSYQASIADQGDLRVSFLDIGQGDSIYIRAANGNDVLIDGGPDDSVIRQLHQVMPSYDHDIGLMVETHPDKDHIAGLVTVFEDYRVDEFLHSEISSGTSFDVALHAHASAEPGLEQVIARRGERFIIDSEHGVYLDILFPDQDTAGFKETNDASIVARLAYGTTSFLLTGDSPISVEDYLASIDKDLLKSDVLKLGHHGSKTSSGDLYLDAVKPQYAIVSAGKNNRYHHPNPETVERVTSRNIKILSTMDLGTVTIESDGKSLWRK